MQAIKPVARLKQPLMRLASARIASAKIQARHISAGSQSSIFARASMEKRAEQLKRWKLIAQKAQALLVSRTARFAFSTEAPKASEEAKSSDFTEKVAPDAVAGASGESGNAGSDGAGAKTGSVPAPDPQQQKSTTILVLLLTVLFIEALTIYSLYLHHVGDDYFQYLSFIPGLQVRCF